MSEFIISPSILSANFARLGEDVEQVLHAGADWIHFDVMDNHYVPNLTIGPMVCQSLREYGIQAPIDVHLMTRPVDDLIPLFAKAGASSISFHPQASDHVDRSLHMIRDHGLKAGLAFNPATPLTDLQYVMEKIDMILIMSVNPGFGGQQFIPSALEKIKEARKLIDDSGLAIECQVDGGVTPNNIEQLARCGATNFVAGSAIFNSGDYAKAIQSMRQALSRVP